MTTQEIIRRLEHMENTNWSHYSAPRLCAKDARDRLEELQREIDFLKKDLLDSDLRAVKAHNHRKDIEKERDEALAEVDRLKRELHDTIESYKLNNLQSNTTRPKPSRLEIAAMLMAAWISSPDYKGDLSHPKWYLSQADALIAAAKEVA